MSSQKKKKENKNPHNASHLPFTGTKLNLVSEAHEASLFANARKNRLIVRNLPFKIDEQGLKNAFAVYGQVQEVSIPKRSDNPKKMLGFGFVQLTNAEDAKTALEVRLR